MFHESIHQKQPSAEEAKEQCASYTASLQTALASQESNTNIIFLRDLNARWGSAKNKLEEKAIGKYGEPNTKRCLWKNSAIEFLLECQITCLNGKEKSRHIPHTFHGRSSVHSVTDMISVSRTTVRREYTANQIEDAILPVACDIKMKRKNANQKNACPRYMNKNLDT